MPPLPPEERDKPKRLGWHQDSRKAQHRIGRQSASTRIIEGRLFSDRYIRPRSRQLLRDNPGSHHFNKIEMPEDNTADPENATPVLVKPGTAVFFDRRLWHAAGRNTSDIVRKVLFYGYSYRWLQPRDDMTVEHFMEHADPIRQQIMGKSTGGHGYTSPGEKGCSTPRVDSGTPRYRSRRTLTQQQNGWTTLSTLNQPVNRPKYPSPEKTKTTPFFLAILEQKIVYFLLNVCIYNFTIYREQRLSKP